MKRPFFELSRALTEEIEIASTQRNSRTGLVSPVLSPLFNPKFLKLHEAQPPKRLRLQSHPSADAHHSAAMAINLEPGDHRTVCGGIGKGGLPAGGIGHVDDLPVMVAVH
jgi:hypothetical protein